MLIFHFASGLTLSLAAAVWTWMVALPIWPGFALYALAGCLGVTASVMGSILGGMWSDDDASDPDWLLRED